MERREEEGLERKKEVSTKKEENRKNLKESLSCEMSERCSLCKKVRREGET